MARNSKIEWTQDSWNPIRARNKATGKVGWHCEHVTPGCVNCYAEGMNKRLGTMLPFKPGHRKDIEIFLDQEMLLEPLRWKKPSQIFVCSMTDLFADFVPDEMIDRVFAIMALCPQHTFQVLTKRAERMRDYFDDQDRSTAIGCALGDMLDGDWIWGEGKQHRRQIEGMISLAHGHAPDDEALAEEEFLPLPNVWLGVSAEDQQRYDERKEHLRETPAAVRFFSMEPLLGPIVADYLGDWIIVGGESGHGARPMHPDWARSLRDQCAAAGVPYFFKQWGEFLPKSQMPLVLQTKAHKRWGALSKGGEFSPSFTTWNGHQEDHPNGECTVFAVGKGKAGRLLDGREHNDMPEVAA